MSYVVEILRPIKKAEIAALVERDSELRVLDEGDNWLTFSWSGPAGKDEVFSFAQARVSITTPSDGAWEKAQSIAAQLQAKVVGEEDEIPLAPRNLGLPATVSSTWIGWPFLVILLLGLLIWRW